MSAQNRIEEIRNHGYDIDFGEVFNKSFENYKKIALNAGLVFILIIIVIGITFMGALGMFWGFSSFSENMVGLKIENLSLVTILLYVAALVVVSGLAAPFTAGILKMAYNAAHNQDFSVGTAFEYYRSAYFIELFSATALLTFFSAGISTAIESFGIPVLGPFVSYAISFFSFLTIPLIIFGDLKAIDAIKGSFLIVSKQFFILLGLVIVAVLLVCMGIFGFCIGIFFTIPFLYSLHFCVYDEIVGTQNTSELDQIGSDIS